MSLISAKNFIAPLQNKVHLGTIILVAICFAFLRGAGASLGFRPTNTNYNSYQQTQPHQAQSQAYPAKREKQTYTGRTATKNPAKNNANSDLFDLEKELGLK